MKSARQHRPLPWAALAAVCAGAGLATCSGCKSPPAQPTAFIGGAEGLEQVVEIKSYHRSWAKRDADWSRFKKIYVAPVSVKYLAQRAGWQKASFAESDRQGVEELAAFTREAFIAAHRANKNTNALEVADGPDDATLVLEMAITELVPTKAWLNSISTAAIGWAPDKGLIAMEARLRDGRSREIIAVFADREQGKESLFNAKNFTWYSHARSIIEEWAAQSVEITNAGEGEAVSDSPAFELKAW